MGAPEKAVRLAGMEFDRSCHACAFFHSREEEYRVLLPFAQEGFERGKKGFHIVDPLVIIGEILQPNPFFVRPDEFLRELRPHVEQALPRDSQAART